MIIGIDGNEANTPVRVGVGQYAYNILSELSKLPTTHSFVVFLKQAPLADMPKSDSHWQYKILKPAKFFTRLALPLYLFFNRKFDLIYSPSHYSPFPCFIPTIPTIHDIGYLQNLKQFNKKDIYQLVNWTKDSLYQARHVIAVSEFTKSELHKTYNLKLSSISVCYNGVGEPLNKKSDLKIDSPYFLSVGTLKPNKNYPFLIESFAKYLKSPLLVKGGAGGGLSPKLVIAGKKGWLFDDIFKTVVKLKLQDKIIFTDYITEIQKWDLYRNAVATIIPSTYEGFGIPAIESQKVGTPVIASNIPSLTEILADSVIYIDPTNQSQLVSALQNIQKPSIAKPLIARGYKISSQFTWTNSAKNLLKVFESLPL